MGQRIKRFDFALSPGIHHRCPVNFCPASALVHTVSLVEPDAPVVDHDELARYSPGWGPSSNPNPPPPLFTSAISAALLARHRRLAAVPLRALRISMVGYANRDSPTVDQWIAYAVNQPAPDGLELDLRLLRPSLCHRDYSLRRSGASATAIDETNPSSGEEDHAAATPSHSNPGSDSDDDDVLSDDGKKDPMAVYRQRFEPQEYSVPRGLFTCAALRSLSLGSVRLALLAAIALPSLETLLLADVTDHERNMQRLISGCSRLADLMLEGRGLLRDGPTLRGGAPVATQAGSPVLPRPGHRRPRRRVVAVGATSLRATIRESPVTHTNHAADALAEGEAGDALVVLDRRGSPSGSFGRWLSGWPATFVGDERGGAAGAEVAVEEVLALPTMTISALTTTA
uniref:F-box/LRR-repeat protein 15/At3g58940/PEG3-like LRR domain-containing protein n=1 Tax=Oryza meridionalis TaxID=40149 RepID=A0A0E0DSR8_9ORYZ